VINRTGIPQCGHRFVIEDGYRTQLSRLHREEHPVTTLSLLRRPAPADGLAEVQRGCSNLIQRGARALARRLSGDDAVAQFGRFVMVGGISSVLYALLFVVSDGAGDLPANVIGSIASSALANEMHRRLTFRADGRISWFAAQWEGGTLAVVGMIATSLALAWVDAMADVSVVQELALVALVTGGVGMVRFLALRWLFVPHAGRG
jgi:putative flippase GtrA